MLLLSVAAMFVASAAAIFQDDLKRMLRLLERRPDRLHHARHSFDSATGLTGGIVHLFNHGITKGALSCCSGGVARRRRHVRFEHLRGIGRVMPLTCSGIVLGGLCLIGVPGTAGFVSKWYLVLAALRTRAIGGSRS